MEEYIHKINGVLGKASHSVVLPKNFIDELHIQKGDFVKINRDNNKIIIKKLEG
ncbi:AbrB/MazE/SpoVT family DNA-binding domain-containing protein [Candidatus Nitrosocosmicus sp. T]